MTSVEADTPCCGGCMTEGDALLTGMDGEEGSCCSEGACTLCEGCSSEKSDPLLTSIGGEECEACASEAGCTKGCSDKTEELASEEGDSEAVDAVPVVEVIE